MHVLNAPTSRLTRGLVLSLLFRLPTFTLSYLTASHSYAPPVGTIFFCSHGYFSFLSHQRCAQPLNSLLYNHPEQHRGYHYPSIQLHFHTHTQTPDHKCFINLIKCIQFLSHFRIHIILVILLLTEKKTIHI